MPSSLTRVLPFTCGYLPSPTCVGLRYGRPPVSLEAFRGKIAQRSRLWLPAGFPSPHEVLSGGFASRTLLGLRRGNSNTTLRLLSCVPPSLITTAGGTGLLTRCPSPTPDGLGLGPTNPPSINVAEEPLGFRCPGFAPGFSATHAGIRTSVPSSRPHDRPSLETERSPTHRRVQSPRSKVQSQGTGTASARPVGLWTFDFGLVDAAASVPGLSPVTLSAPDHSTSELLRTL